MNEILNTQAMAAAMVGFDNAERWSVAVEGLIETMRANLDGKVVRTYDVATDNSVWTFGSQNWQILRKPGTDDAWEDDLLAKSVSFGGRGEVPLAEFLTYLREWYWPRRKLSAEEAA